MTQTTSPSLDTLTFTSSAQSQSPDSSTSSTPTQELPQDHQQQATSSSSSDPSTRGRPRYKRRQPSRRYYTPPSRVPSPVRPDFMLEVESAPQDPDIFADAETDYFSSAERNEGPRAFRRHFFDAMSDVNVQGAGEGMGGSIDAILAGRSGR